MMYVCDTGAHGLVVGNFHEKGRGAGSALSQVDNCDASTVPLDMT